MKVRVEINYDSDAKAALVSLNGRPAYKWVGAELSLRTIFDTSVNDDGWRVSSPKSQTISFSAARARNA